MEMITLTCPDCKGTLQVDEDHMLMKCPYCSSGKLIIEDKEITLKRLDIQKKKLEMEDEERKYQRRKQENEEDDFGIKEQLKYFGMILLMGGGVAAFIGLIVLFTRLFN